MTVLALYCIFNCPSFIFHHRVHGVTQSFLITVPMQGGRAQRRGYKNYSPQITQMDTDF